MTEPSADYSRPRPPTGAGTWLALALLGAGAAALSFNLWPVWQGNADLSHGLLMPAVFLLLLHQSRTQGPPRFIREGRISAVFLGALLVVGLLTLAAAGLYAAALSWTHALVGFCLCAATTLLLGAGWIVLAGERVRVIGFNWPAGVAVGLWMLCSPIPPGTYQRITLWLQLQISEAVLGALHILGIPAVRQGNILQLARVTVGVEEACSGIRSLISCLFAAFLLSALLVRRPAARAGLIVVAPLLAIGMNFVRSLTLTLLAEAGVDIGGTWHDLTGYAVLGLTTVALAGLAILLDRTGSPPSPRSAAGLQGVSRRPVILCAGLLSASVLAFGFVALTRPASRATGPAPDLLELLPAQIPGWEVATANLYEFSGTLQTEHLAQRRYVQQTAAGLTEVTLYVAYWPAGRAPVSAVATHTPDACWPGGGWTRVAVTPERAELQVGGRSLFPAEYRVFAAQGQRQQVWFWHLHDGHPLSHRDPYSPLALLRIALAHGFTRPGEQLFVRISSNQAWAGIADSEPVEQFFTRAKRLGL